MKVNISLTSYSIIAFKLTNYQLKYLQIIKSQSMKKLFLILVILMFISNLYSQTATYKDVLANNKGIYETYLSYANQSFKVGDTLTIGEPYRNNNYFYLFQYYIKTTFPLTTSSIGASVVIKKMEINNNSLIVYTSKPRKDIYGLCIINFEEAIKQGEIKSSFLTSDDALKLLKTEKEKLELGVITLEQYDVKKAELMKYMK